MTSTDNLQEITLEEIKNNLENINSANVAIWRMNRDNEMVVIPVQKLPQFLGEKDAGTFKFYIESDWRGRIKEYESALKEKKIQRATNEISPDILMNEIKKHGNVEEESAMFQKMTVIEREEVLDDCITKLSEKEGNKTLDVALIVKMVDIFCKTLYANNAEMQDIISTTDISVNIFGVLKKSSWVIQILVNLFDNKKFPYNDLGIIELISTGSKTIDHINKVFLRFLTFCIFFNDYIGEGLFTKNIRGVFKERYQRHYKKRFPEMEVTIEKIFSNGIRRIDKEKELKDYVLGALLFDTGKLSNVKYHDSNEIYNHEIVKKHALNSYNMITKAKQYSFDVLAMSVFHHEYYGGKGSYNFTKPLLSKFSGKPFSGDNFRYFISYDKNDFINGVSLAYFPCKVLEMIDVYDALVSKKNMAAVEALRLMKKDFIIKSLKIDPVLFKIFMEYNFRCNVITAQEMEGIDSTIY